MKLRVLLAAGALAIGVSAYGQATTGSASTSSVDLGNLFQRLEESPFGMSYYFEAGTARDPEKATQIDGVSVLHIPTLKYKISDKDSVSWSNRWDTTYRPDEAADDQWTDSTFNYYRSGLLSQDKHGISATLHIRQRFYPFLMDTMEETPGAQGYAYSRAGVIFSRSLTANLSVSVPLYFAKYWIDSGEEGARTSYFYIPASVGYSATDKLSFGLIAEYFHRNGKGEGKGDFESLDLTAETSYQLTKKVGIGASMGWLGAMMAHDGKTFGATFDELRREQISFGVNANFSIF